MTCGCAVRLSSYRLGFVTLALDDNVRSAEPRRDYLAALDDAGLILAHAGTTLVQVAVLTHPSLTH